MKPFWVPGPLFLSFFIGRCMLKVECSTFIVYWFPIHIIRSGSQMAIIAHINNKEW